MFTQIFLSEIISIAENGGQGTHFLISQILKDLTHCALWRHYELIQAMVGWGWEASLPYYHCHRYQEVR